MEPIAAPIALTIVVADPRVEVAAKALAWHELSDYGRRTCDWHGDFTDDDRAGFRAQAAAVLEALDEMDG